MAIASLGMSVVKAGTQIGKHKIPRFIYHITNKSNYESMLKDGFVKMSKSDDTFRQGGVFSIDLVNFFKRWKFDKSWKNNLLMEKFIQQVSKGNNDIVILKIPTKNLNQDLLVTRSQNILFGWKDRIQNNYKNPEKIKEKVFQHLNELVLGNGQTVTEQTSKAGSKDVATEIFQHLTDGTPVQNSKLLKHRKHAIEYIYKSDIPVSDIEKIGELNIADLKATSEYDVDRPMHSIFTHLLTGTPEVKGAELLNC